MIPLYLRKVYYKEPVFANSNIIYSAYPKQFEGDFGENFKRKAQIDSELPLEDLEVFNNGDSYSLNIGGMKYADKVIIADDVEKDYTEEIDEDKIALQGDDEITPEAIVQLYKTLINQEEKEDKAE